MAYLRSSLDDSFDIDDEVSVRLGQFQQETEEEQNLDLDADDVILGCKRIFLLPFEPIWYYTMLLIAASHVYITIYEAGFRVYGKNDGLGMEFTVIKYLSSFMYTLDILLLIGGKTVHGLHLSPSEIHRPKCVLLADLISILPLQFLVPTEYITPFTAKLYYVIQLTDCLKAVRIFHTFYHIHNSVGSSKLHLQIFEYYFTMGLAIMVGFVVTYHIVCLEIACPDVPTQSEYFNYLYIAVSKITARGITNYPDNLFWKFTVSILGYIIFMVIICGSTAYVTVALYTLMYHHYGYLNKLKLVYIAFETYSIPKSIRKMCLQYFDLFWKSRNGYTVNYQNFSALAHSMYDEIELDISWYALKHSKLLRNMDIPFLRHTSVYVQSKFFLPGQVIYNKNKTKDMMIYVVSGVIQVLSNEDDDTPILSFSAGTCLGESSLILNYEPKAIVRCKTFCILHVLEAKNFVKLMKVFSEQFLKLRQDFNKRLLMARKNHSFSKTLQHNYGIVERTNYITIMWLKATLHRLMMKDRGTSQGHQCQNIFLRDELDDEKFIDRHFTAKNLDMLVISERLELITDTVFLKTSCPCVFQPVSVVLNVWDGLIIVFAIINAFVIPYFALVEPKIPLWYDIWVYIITTLWLTDLYVQISIATKKGEEIVADVVRIFLVKIKTPAFLLDLFSSIPLEIFSSIIIAKVSPQNQAFLRLNRVLKIWKVQKIFNEREQQLNTNLVLSRYFKHCCVLLFTAYLCSCIMFSVNCFDSKCVDNDELESTLIQLLWCGEIVTHILTGVSTPSKLCNKTLYQPFFLCLTLLSTAFFVFIYGSLAAEYALERVNYSKVIGIFTDILSTVSIRGLSNHYYKRIFVYVETQWMENQASKLLYKYSPFVDMPPHIYRLFREVIYKDKLLNVAIFQELSDRVLIDMCMAAKVVVMPPNEVICYTGDINQTFYIIADGYCKVLADRLGADESILSEGDSISVLEACLGIPVMHTVITITHCRVITLSQNSLKEVYFKYPIHKEEVEKALEEINIDHNLNQNVESNLIGTKDIKEKIQKEKEPSFFKYSYNIQTDSLEEYNYYIPFDRLGFLSFVQYFLMRLTILPEGKFLYRWEICRCICAVLTALLFSLPGIGTCTKCDWYFLLALLDGMAWIDIYVRLHVCYYNKMGILVTHPLTTAIHYMKHGFLVDFIAVFPMHLFFAAKRRHYNKILTLLQLNRLLQMHRYFGFFHYIETKSFVPTRKVAIAKYFPIILILCVCIGSGLINIICDFDKNLPGNSIFTKGVKCMENTWISNSKFKKPLSPARVQAYAVYFATSILTLTGMTGFEIQSTVIAIFGLPLAFLAYILNVHVVSTALCQYTGGYSTLLEYQESMNVVKKFMKYFKVRIDIQKKIIAYFELKWHRKRGHSVHETIKRFSRPLQQDVLYDIYGKTLQEATVFTGDSRLFLRNLVLDVTHEVCTKDSFIISINDVTQYVHILFKGKVSVLAPDGSQLTILTPGSMFGNLDDCDMTRQTVSVLALGHVEILLVKSLRYHTILDNYPNLHKQYKRLIALHVDYIKSRVRIQSEDQSIYATNFSNTTSKNLFKIISGAVFFPNNIFIRVWRLIILIGVCYIEVGVSFYQTSMEEYSIGFIIFQYICDLLYAINYYVITHTAYENKFGLIVTNLRMIKKKFYKDRVAFCCCLIGMIPFDICVWFFPSSKFHILYPILRLNRLLRLVYFIHSFNQQKKRLTINLHFMRFTYIALWSTFILHFCTCVILTLSCTHNPSMYPEINCNKMSLSAFEKITVYIEYLYVTISCFTCATQKSSYPESIRLTILCIFIMVLFQILAATLLGQIYSIIRIRYYKQNTYARNLEKIRDFMEKEHLSDSLFTKAYEYMRYLWRKRRGASFPRLLLTSPSRVREPILNSAFGNHINNHFIFEKCHIDFNRQVVACLRNETFFQDDYIVFKGTVRQSMYFIHNGEVVVLTEDSSFNETVTETLKPGMSFGVTQGLFPKIPYSYTFRANKTTVILCLELNMWEHLFRFFPASKAIIKSRYIEYQDKYA